LLFAPVGALGPVALTAVAKGGVVMCGGIYMSDIPSFPYAFLWGERRLVSVANLTREDGAAFLRVAGQTRLEIETTLCTGRRQSAAQRSARGKTDGAAVLSIR
jgi:propanol-preferring alcohol dehydrogenase